MLNFTVNVCVTTEGAFKCDDKNYWIISTVMSSLIILIYPVLSSEYPKPINHDFIQCFVVNCKLMCPDTMYLKSKALTVFCKHFCLPNPLWLRKITTDTFILPHVIRVSVDGSQIKDSCLRTDLR